MKSVYHVNIMKVEGFYLLPNYWEVYFSTKTKFFINTYHKYSTFSLCVKKTPHSPIFFCQQMLGSMNNSIYMFQSFEMTKRNFYKSSNLLTPVLHYRIQQLDHIHSITKNYSNFINMKNLEDENYLKCGSFFFIEKAHFGGRSGGLKRKKKKKEERIMNKGEAKRMEFFYPKKRKRVRIRLVQNSRRNIVYDNVLKRFLVYYYRQGIQVFRSFSTKKKKDFETARNKAIMLAEQHKEIEFEVENVFLNERKRFANIFVLKFF